MDKFVQKDNLEIILSGARVLQDKDLMEKTAPEIQQSVPMDSNAVTEMPVKVTEIGFVELFLMDLAKQTAIVSKIIAVPTINAKLASNNSARRLF